MGEVGSGPLEGREQTGLEGLPLPTSCLPQATGQQLSPWF